MKKNNAHDVAHNMWYSEYWEKEWKEPKQSRSLMKAMWNVSDDLLKTVNTNILTENYKDDPIYKYMNELENNKNEWFNKPWWINYYHFTHGYKRKIEDRTLSQDDYLLIYDTEKDTIKEDIFERYWNLQKNFKPILWWEITITSWFDWAGTPYRNISGHFWSKLIDPSRNQYSSSTLITISEWQKTYKESIDYLEWQLEKCKKLSYNWADPVDIALFLKDPSYEKVIDIKQDLWEYWKVRYSHSNRTHNIGWLARWYSLEEMINDLSSKQFLFNQKDQVDNIDYEWPYYKKSPYNQMSETVSKRDSYKRLYNFWFGENNASQWFDWPSSAYGIDMMSTFSRAEYEGSARILMKLMSEYWNKWEVAEDLCQKATIENLTRVNAIVIENWIVKFTDKAINIIRNKYTSERNSALESFRRLWIFFEENQITLPEDYKFEWDTSLENEQMLEIRAKREQYEKSQAEAKARDKVIFDSLKEELSSADSLPNLTIEDLLNQGYNEKEIQNNQWYSKISDMEWRMTLVRLIDHSDLRQMYQDLIKSIQKHPLYRLADNNFKSDDDKKWEYEIKEEIIGSVDEKYIFEFIMNHYLWQHSNVSWRAFSEFWDFAKWIKSPEFAQEILNKIGNDHKWRQTSHPEIFWKYAVEYLEWIVTK